MKNGWYILNYHDISWEENAYLRGIVGSLPPDIFQSHLDYLNQHGKIVSIEEGFNKYITNSIDEPLFSIWFDDGYSGIRKYALPIIDEFGIAAAMSINSNFLLKKELFWRLKLSYISQTDGLRFLRSKLRKLGFKKHHSVTTFVLDSFSDDVLKAVDDVYNDFSNEIVRQDAFRAFEDVEGVKTLLDKGWTIGNHSAGHYPITEELYFDHFTDEFEKCEDAIHQHFNINTKYWVIPFDRTGMRAKNLLSYFYDNNSKNRNLVLLEGKVNKYPDKINNILFRIVPENVDGKGLIKQLNKIDFYKGETII